MNRPFALLLFLSGLLLGGALVYWLPATTHAHREEQEPVLPLSRPDELEIGVEASHTLPPATTIPPPPESQGEPSSNRQEFVDSDPVFSAALMDLAQQNLLKGWASKRPDTPAAEELAAGLEEFQVRTPLLAGLIGIELARRRTDLELAEEDARTGGVFSVLDRLQKGGPGPLPELVRDQATFDRFFQSEFTGSAIDGRAALLQPKKNEPVPDGSVLTFPAGVFPLKDFGKYWRDHFPRDLTFRGAGKEATLLVLESDISAKDIIRNMVLEDCTVYTNDNYLFDIRQPPMSLTMRRVRLMGWDMGVGGSKAFATESLALRAMDCDFLGGYGRSPGSGNLFDVRHAGLLARFDNCVVSHTSVFRHLNKGATLVFSRSRLEEILDRKDDVPNNVSLDRTVVSYLEQGNSVPPKTLNDLFPDWRARLREQ